MAREALSYARELHRGQRRASDEAPFILHPLEVASLLYNTGHSEPVVAVGILHDILEDTPVRPHDLEERFGAEVAGLVSVMTEDSGIEPFEARKAALRHRVAKFNGSAIAVYASDKVAKVRELRAHATRDPRLLAPDGPAQARLDHYLESLAMLEDSMPDHPLVRQLRFELEALQALPPKATVGRGQQT